MQFDHKIDCKISTDERLSYFYQQNKTKYFSVLKVANVTFDMNSMFKKLSRCNMSHHQ